MKKLKLESLEVTSFATTPGAGAERGTVDGHMPKPGGPGPIQTYNVDLCGDTNYFDCTLGCTRDTCPGSCMVIE